MSKKFFITLSFVFVVSGCASSTEIKKSPCACSFTPVNSDISKVSVMAYKQNKYSL
jgi:hypothetical protein